MKVPSRTETLNRVIHKLRGEGAWPAGGAMASHGDGARGVPGRSRRGRGGRSPRAAGSPRGLGRWLGSLWLACALALVPAAGATGAEIHSNGRGGGLWSEPATWHGGQVPGPEDTVVIAMRDRVEFDGDDRAQPTCRALHLDPEAVLSFRDSRGGRRTLTVAGPVESYGTIRIDGTGDRRGMYELRLVGEGRAARTVTLQENAGLLIYGYEHHRDERNVRLVATSLDPEAEGAPTPARIIADGRVMFDLHHAHVRDVELELSNLDNSGGARERLNIIGSALTGRSRLRLENCDTPTVRDNHFHADGDAAPDHAIRMIGNTLAQIIGNTIEGPYDMGLHINPDRNSTLADLQIRDVTTRGVYMRNVTDTVLRNVHIESEDATEGVWLQSSYGGALLEQVRVVGADRGFRVRHSRAQMSDCAAEGMAVPDEERAGVGLHVHRSSVRLINSPFDPDEIEINADGSPPGDDEPYVETMQHVVVRVLPAEEEVEAETDAAQAPAPGGAEASARRGGEAPAGLGAEQFQPRDAAHRTVDLPRGVRVRMQTAEASGGVPADRADLNVRNSPVPVSRTGFTPMPGSQHGLAVRSWRYDREAQFRQAPFYELIVEKPTGEEDEAYRTLASETVEPRADWFRPEPNRPEPTIEVTLP